MGEELRLGAARALCRLLGPEQLPLGGDPVGHVADRPHPAEHHAVQAIGDRVALEHSAVLEVDPPPAGPRIEIGRASCRTRVCQYVWISVVAVSLKKTQTK